MKQTAPPLLNYAISTAGLLKQISTARLVQGGSSFFLPTTWSLSKPNVRLSLQPVRPSEFVVVTRRSAQLSQAVYSQMAICILRLCTNIYQQGSLAKV